MIRIKLTNAEIIETAMSGVLRRMQRLKSGYAYAHGLKRGNDWQLMIEGCLTERAVAKHLRLHWGGCGQINDVDVDTVEVRSTPYKKGKLIVHKSDADNSKFYLVTGIDGDYVIHGWIWGRDAKNEKYWGELQPGRPSYNVPQNMLNSLHE
tara:strand:+ start:151 stop:603 length:453 start_codon:yes stop_codon:yes gene_type:complete